MTETSYCERRIVRKRKVESVGKVDGDGWGLRKSGKVPVYKKEENGGEGVERIRAAEAMIGGTAAHSYKRAVIVNCRQ